MVKDDESSSQKLKNVIEEVIKPSLLSISGGSNEKKIGGNLSIQGVDKNQRTEIKFSKIKNMINGSQTKSLLTHKSSENKDDAKTVNSSAAGADKTLVSKELFDSMSYCFLNSYRI